MMISQLSPEDDDLSIVTVFPTVFVFFGQAQLTVLPAVSVFGATQYSRKNSRELRACLICKRLRTLVYKPLSLSQMEDMRQSHCRKTQDDAHACYFSKRNVQEQLYSGFKKTRGPLRF